MRGFTQSLNVSVACACILQSVTERRRTFLGRNGRSFYRKAKNTSRRVDRS